MKRSILAILIPAVFVASPGWAQETTPVQAQPAAPIALFSPPIPPGRPVPAVAPVKHILPPLTVDVTKPLTVDDSLTIAFERNPDLRIATDVARRAVGVVNEARANFYPRFNAQASYTVQPPSTTTFGGQNGQPSQTIVTQPANVTVVGINGTLPLDISKRLTYSTDIARFQYDIQYLNLVSTSERVIQNVKIAYYDLLRACGQAQVAQAAVDVSKVRLANTRARFEAGTVPKFDVTTAEVDLANLNQQLIQAQTRVETFKSVFNRTLGIEINTPTRVVDVTPQIVQTAIDIDADIAVAEARRPEMRAGRTAVALNQTNVRLQRTGLLPSLNINAGSTFNPSTTTFSTNNFNWQATAVLSVPIWDGGITKARVQQARADVLNAADTLDQTKLAVEVDVRNSALNVEEAVKRTQTTAEAVTLAEEALRLANVRYEAGIAVLVEVTNAESQLTQARFNLVNAQYDYAVAVAALERATSTQPELNRVQLLSSPVAGQPVSGSEVSR